MEESQPEQRAEEDWWDAVLSEHPELAQLSTERERSGTCALDAETVGLDRTMPFGGDEFTDELIAAVCRFLGLRELGRLACVSRRFTVRTLTEPGSDGVLLSPIEEGARLRLLVVAAAAGNGDGVASWQGQVTWLQALWYAECRLLFTSCGPAMTLSEEGAWLSA